MSKIIAAINVTLDGFCDHTAVTPDEEIHYHYRALLQTAGLLLYGRITYQLMEFWPPLVKQPSGNKSMDDFAVIMDQAPKLVFSNTLKTLNWPSARLATESLEETVQKLRAEDGKDVLVCSRSLIIALLNRGLLDELQLCIYPVLAANGLPLFEKIKKRVELRYIKTKHFSGTGAMLVYYDAR
ncbi:MAG TPA: dihydrofolate reductase family protein [Chitinophagaceae bacterium]|nr:dihydrofolate reductase family protein [Chitinophagaceae bacterium]